MTSSQNLTMTLVPAERSPVFETRRLVVMPDRCVWLGRADETQNRSPMIDNGWMSSPALDDKNAMLYVCWGEVHPFHLSWHVTVR